VNYYNDHDPFCAEWAGNLIATGEVPDGVMDPKPIQEVQPDELRGFTQCHLFSGVLGWPTALRLAGWPDDRPVWTGSCPCQPFSSAGKQLGERDPRHLWPEFYRLIAACRPPVVFGEQVSGKLGRKWNAGVYADLEAIGYRVPRDGAGNYEFYDLPAACVGAPHIRQRLFWVADTEGGGFGIAGSPPGKSGYAVECCETGGMGDSGGAGPQERISDGRTESGPTGASPWQAFELAGCRDGRIRRVSAQPGDEPLALRIPVKLGPGLAGLRGVAKDARRNRVGRLRGYGNSIVPAVAARFIRAYMQERGSND
jgi:DNA (cytosine-5)-methyltransferase 1